MKKIIFVFCVAFALNLIWEEAHSHLYIAYQHASITHEVLLRAALFDALVISIAAMLYFFTKTFSGRIWLIALLLFLFAVCLEWFALATGRWEYGASMPIIPILGTGLTPTLQLAVTGILAIACTRRVRALS